ncbi:hypothetical protein G7054_g7837 [Neopestalotiopsis clavispora]|nr:hypothetical protein G7054_g7837 [Neopestalotiopsis clavispora]
MTTSAAGSDHQQTAAVPAQAENANHHNNSSNPEAGEILRTHEAATKEETTDSHTGANGGTNKSNLELSLDLNLDLDSLPASDYWDASTMASLNAVSAVSRHCASARLQAAALSDLGPPPGESPRRRAGAPVRGPAGRSPGRDHDAGGESAELLRNHALTSGTNCEQAMLHFPEERPIH